jgi:hypothetical protein
MKLNLLKNGGQIQTFLSNLISNDELRINAFRIRSCGWKSRGMTPDSVALIH